MHSRTSFAVITVLLGVLVLTLHPGCATYRQGRPGVYDLPHIERVAVWAFGNDEFTDGVAEVLVYCSKWKVFDRLALDRILQEQALEQTTNFDTETAVRIGKLAGVNMVVFGTYAEDRAVMKAVDIESGQYYVYKNVYFDPARDMDFKAWFACQHLVPYAIRYEDGEPAFVWCGDSADKLRPRDLP